MQAFETSKDAITISEQTGDLFSKAFVYSIHGLSCYGKGYLDDAVDYLSKGAEYADKIGQHYWNQASHHFLGEIYYLKNKYSKAQRHFEKTIEYLRQHKYLPSLLNLNELALARIKSAQNPEAINFQPLYEFESANRVKQFQGWASKHLAETLINNDPKHILEAEIAIKKAIAADTKNEMMFHLGRDYIVYSQILGKKNEPSNATDMFIKAINIFKECEAEGWIELYEDKLLTA